MRTTCILLLLGWALAPVARPLAAAGSPAFPDLTGQVSRDDGTFVNNATVFIYTAGPKVGTASLCPSCYADCRKKAQTDAAGKFKIEALDPKLVFKLLVVAGGCEAQFVPKVDPAAGPIEVICHEIDPETLRSKSRVAGLVIGPGGEALVGAVLSIEGIERGSSTRWGGTDQDADPVAVADDKGHFSMRSAEGVTALHALAEGRGVAKRWVRLMPGRDHLVRMQEGVMVQGRVIRKGQPLPGVVVGLITTEREAGKCLHDFEATTDQTGTFSLDGVTPENSYWLFSRMDSLQDRGALPLKPVKAGETGTVLRLGDLEVEPAYKVNGHLVLSDQKPIPPNTRLLLGREEAWDHSEVTLAPDGSFTFNGVPNESVTLSVRLRGYKLSKRNPSLDWMNGSIMGRVEKDITDLQLLMEPGQWQYLRRGLNDDEAPPEADRQPRDKPLRGIALDNP